MADASADGGGHPGDFSTNLANAQQRFRRIDYVFRPVRRVAGVATIDR
jgi:hypothetical protein